MQKRATRNEFRIIGGRWRGRKLKFDDRPGLRPTPDRVRETLFNWLAPRIRGARCLDLFAGTGALGLEALSRGAAAVTFVEQDQRSAQTINAALHALGSDGGAVVAQDALEYVVRCTTSFDVVFADPPFSSDLLSRLCTLLLERAVLTDTGLLYAEFPRGAAPSESDDGSLRWEPLRHKTAGRVGFGLYRIPDTLNDPA